VNKELVEIIDYLERPGRPDAVLATVINVEGSSYRLPGARMLIAEGSWRTVGNVSGGCLEADVIERAQKVLRTGRPEVLTYDTRNDLESVFSLNMGCRGVVTILLERPSERFTRFIKKRLKTRRPGVIATCITSGEGDNAEIGSQAFIDEDAVSAPEIADVTVAAISSAALAVLREGRSGRLETSFGDFFLEFIPAPTDLLVFGAGADAVPVADLAKRMGWRVTVVDHRPAFATRERFPVADEVLLSTVEQLAADLRIENSTATIVMTHNYQRDREILKFLLGSRAFYIGALGPKKRTERILDELKTEELRVTPEDLERLYAPIGLDIGGGTPELIALSIIAEIQTVRTGRTGGFLRERKGSINNRRETSMQQSWRVLSITNGNGGGVLVSPVDAARERA